jgi:hypothetical protein
MVGNHYGVREDRSSAAPEERSIKEIEDLRETGGSS